MVAALHARLSEADKVLLIGKTAVSQATGPGLHRGAIHHATLRADFRFHDGILLLDTTSGKSGEAARVYPYGLLKKRLFRTVSMERALSKL